MTTTGRYACGHCHNRHDSFDAIRACGTAYRASKAQATVAAPVATPFARPTLTGQVAQALTITGVRSDVAATGPQMGFISSLNAERQVPVAGSTEEEAWLIERNFDALGSGKVLLKAEATRVIGWLKGLPFASQAQATPVVPTSSPAAAPSRQPYPQVKEGYYAIASATGNNDLDFFRVDRPTEGRFAGRTFVKRVVGGKPEFPVRGEQARAALTAILAAGERGASLRYGREIGRCGRCNRHLTDETSRALGLGPDCAQK